MNRAQFVFRRTMHRSIRAGIVVLLVVAARVDVASATLGGRAARSPAVGGDLHSLVVDPSDSARLFVGGHERVAMSRDGGSSWRSIPSLEDADAMGWAFDGRRILVGGHPGLHVSEDGGRTFALRNAGLPVTDIHAVGGDGELIYVASPQAGVLMSSDGGKKWGLRTRNAGQAFMGRMLVDPLNPDHVVASDMQAGAVESIDGGRTWRALGTVRGAIWVSWDPTDTSHLVVSTVNGFVVSYDGGDSWSRLDVPTGAAVVDMDPRAPQTIYAAASRDGRAVLWISRDSGATWSES